MSVLIISCVFPPEPVVSAKLSHDIAVNLSKKGDDVTVVSPIPTRPYKFKFEFCETNDSFEHVILDSFTSPLDQVYLPYPIPFWGQDNSTISKWHKSNREK